MKMLWTMNRQNNSVHWLQPASVIGHPSAGRMGVWMEFGGKYVWAQQHGLLLTKADLATTFAKCLTWQPELSLWYTTSSPWDQLDTWLFEYIIWLHLILGYLITLGSPILERRVIYFLPDWHIFQDGFAFLDCLLPFVPFSLPPSLPSSFLRWLLPSFLCLIEV